MNKDYKPNKKDKILVVFITIFSILILGGITYTFFSVGVSNTNNEKIQTSTATMSLTFDDNDNGVSGTLNLGQSIVKKFTLENTGTVNAYGKINWYNLVNTYTEDSLTWTLEQSTSENGTYTTIGTGKVPTSSTNTTKKLKSGILVPVSTTYYYKLTITLNNLDINQSGDINASMHSQFSLESGQDSGTDTIMDLVSGEPTNTTNIITKTAPQGETCTNTFAYDGTTDNNLRYVGINPCNYVTFNSESPRIETRWIIEDTSTGVQGPAETYASSELCDTALSKYGSPGGWDCISKTMAIGGWRIIGVMNNVDDGSGHLETRLKLIRNEALGVFSWDSSDSEINSGYGVNDWTQADLKNELNGDYLDTSLNANTTWYSGLNNKKTWEYDYTQGLKASAQSLIGNTKWYLGGASYAQTFDLAGEGTAAKYYLYERGTSVWGSTSGQTCNDGACPRALFWTGKVALMYPSDYGYAVGGTVRNTCLNKKLGTYSTDYCFHNIWIPQGWSISPGSDYFDYVYGAFEGNLDDYKAAYRGGFSPVVYLKSEASISSGNGSVSEPYVIG